MHTTDYSGRPYYGKADHQPWLYCSTTDRTVKLHTHPHYTDKRFKKPQTVFCSEPEALVWTFGSENVPDLFYNYSDRLSCGEEHDAAVQAADASGHERRTANWYEAYLTAYYGNPVELVHVVAGVNHSNGYPYAVYGTRDKS